MDPFKDSEGTFPSTGNNKLGWILFLPNQLQASNMRVQVPPPGTPIVHGTGSDHYWISTELNVL